MGDLVTRVKRQVKDHKEIFVIHITDKGPISRIYKDSQKSIVKNKQSQ